MQDNMKIESGLQKRGESCHATLIDHAFLNAGTAPHIWIIFTVLGRQIKLDKKEKNKYNLVPTERIFVGL